MKTLYTAHATAVGGRQGHTQTDDGKISLDLASPGSGKEGSNPEQLFACGYAACFGSAIDFVAKQQKLEVGTITVASDVRLNQGDDGFSIGVTLNVSLPSLNAAAASALVNAAHQVCPYSKATRGNVVVELRVNDQPLAAAA